MATGSVENLPSGSFRAVVSAGIDPITGKRIKLTETCATEALALQARDRLVDQVEADNAPARSATVAMLMERWMEVADHSLNTRETTASYVRRTINPGLGDWLLRKLQHRVDILDRFYKHLGRCGALCDGRPFIEHLSADPHECSDRCKPHVCEPLSPATVRRIHNMLSPALSYAVSWGWIDRNPAEYAHPPKLKRRRARPPEAEQVARLLNLAFASSTEFALFLWLATTTGARRGELAALRWNFVDLRAGVIRIEHNYVQRAGNSEIKETKTDQDRRLSLDPLTVQMLTDYRAQLVDRLAPARVKLARDSFLFSPDPAGQTPWHPDHFTHAFRELADLVGITEPLKNLRHFNATQLLSAGVDLATTAGRLGHGDGGATTLKVYANWMPATDRRAVEQLATDLMALRAAQTTHEAAAPPLRRAARPIEDVLEPPKDGRANYLVVAEALRASIGSGRLQADDVVPTIDQLAAWFGIARSTAQRAVSQLGASGDIVRSGHRWRVPAPTH